MSCIPLVLARLSQLGTLDIVVCAIPVDSREAVSNHNAGTPLPGLVQCILDNLLTLCVQGRGGLIQEENLWISH